MGLFGALHAIKQATKIENDVRAMREGVDTKAISKESLKLQCYVIDYDIERYSKQHEAVWQRTAKGLKGISDIYKEIMNGGDHDDKTLNRMFGEEQLGMVMAEHVGDEMSYYYYAGRAKAIVGLHNGALYYDFTGKSRPIMQNSAFISAIRKAGLL